MIGLGALVSAFALARMGTVIPLAVTAAYAFLTIRFEDVSILDFVRNAFLFLVGQKQLYEWGDDINE